MRVRTSRYVPRRPSRHALRMPCQVVREKDFALVADRMVELSEGGMLVVPRMRVLTGESLIVSFMAPYSRSFVDAEATVARVVHGRRDGDGGFALGLSIDWMDRIARELIRGQIAHLPESGRQRRALA
jgi:hypothetical protein